MSPMYLIDDAMSNDIAGYISEATAIPSCCVDVNSVLSTWGDAKSYLFSYMHDSLSVRRHVHVDCTDADEMKSQISDIGTSIVSNVCESLNERDIDLHKAMPLFNAGQIIEGKLVNDVILSGGACGKDLKLPRGMKPMRAIRKMLEYYGCCDRKQFESYRDSVSRIMTDKCMDCDVTLSIHPLDFLSMSDNSCGWTSCMAWTGGGLMSGGVIEMMNSPFVVVAYVSDGTDYRPGVPNKTWRELIIVDPGKFVIGSRQYPFSSSGLSKSILEFAADIFGINGSVTTFDDVRDVVKYAGNEDVYFNTPQFVNLLNDMPEGTVIPYTHHMYNDLFNFPDEKYLCVKDICFDGRPMSLNIAVNETTCACCGKRISHDEYLHNWASWTKICKDCEDKYVA